MGTVRSGSCVVRRALRPCVVRRTLRPCVVRRTSCVVLLVSGAGSCRATAARASTDRLQQMREERAAEHRHLGIRSRSRPRATGPRARSRARQSARSETGSFMSYRSAPCGMSFTCELAVPLQERPHTLSVLTSWTVLRALLVLTPCPLSLRERGTIDQFPGRHAASTEMSTSASGRRSTCPRA